MNQISMNNNSSVPSTNNLVSRSILSPRSTWYWGIQILVAVLSFSTNGSVICVILFRKRLHTTPNWFILSLAISGVLMSLAIFPFEFICTFGSCILLLYEKLRIISILASTFSLFCVALDRYFAVVHPLKYQRFSASKKVFLVIGLCWCFSFIIPLTSFMKYFVKCASKGLKIYHLTVLICWLVLINMCLLITYSKMLLVAKRHNQRVLFQARQVRYNYRTSGHILADKTCCQLSPSVKLTGALILFYLSCSLLAFINDIEKSILSKELNATRYVAAQILLPLNSLLNAVAYALIKKDIRKELRKLYCNISCKMKS